MKQRSIQSKNEILWPAFLCVALSGLGLIYFAGYYKPLVFLVGLGSIYLFLTHALTPLRCAPVLLLLGYVAFSGLGGLWAMSGKFFLREYSKIFVAGGIFLLVVLSRRFDRHWLSRMLGVVTGMCAIYALLSVEAATTGITAALLQTIPDFKPLTLGFEAGVRLTGIFGNGNIAASIFSLGILFSLALLQQAQSLPARRWHAATACVNAFAFVLCFSMGGMACFALAIVAYLIFAGSERSAVLVRMLVVAVPTMVFVALAFPFFNRTGVAVWIPLLAMAANVAVVVALEGKASPRITAAVQARKTLGLLLLVGIFLVAGIYMVAGYQLTGPHTFGTDPLRRSAYPKAGEHTLSVDATQDVTVTVISQDMSQIMMHTNTVVYQGSAQQGVFTVPENSEVCYFTFTAPSGTVISQALLDGQTAIPLKYTLLPGFIANRIQGLWANQNAIQRTVFFEDGMKLFFKQPLVGNGVGAFETGVTSVQEFHYQTRYIHNHYIQILLEGGAVALALFAGAVLFMVLALWRRRSAGREWAFGWVYPALWAALVMIVAHAAVEVSMSMIVFLCLAFFTFAVIVRVCVELPPAPAQEIVKKKQAATKKMSSSRPLGLACAVLPSVFVLSLLCNSFAGYLIRKPVASAEVFFENLNTAVAIDPYEKNDAKHSFLLNTIYENATAEIPKANEYAQQLLQVQSNSLPQVLCYYYLNTNQYPQAIQAAMTGASYSASDPAVWNEMIALLRSAFVDTLQSPLLGEAGPALGQGLLDYYTVLQQRNQSSMAPIALDVASQDFFSKLLRIAAKDYAGEEIFFTTNYHLFDLAFSCDADGNGVPDQITLDAGGGTASQGELSVAAQGTVQLSLWVRESTQVQVSIAAQDPAALTLRLAGSDTTLTPQLTQQGQASFTLPITLLEPEDLVLELTSATAQTITNVEITQGG